MIDLNYYIWSFEHNGWWRRNNCGYTSSLRQAGKYTHGNAKQICDNANAYQPTNNPNEEMIHVTDHSRIEVVSIGTDYEYT